MKAAVIVSIPTEFARITVIRRAVGDKYDVVVNGKVHATYANAEDVIKLLGYYLKERKI